MKQIMNEKCPVCDERFGLYSEKTQIKSHDGQSIIDIHQHCHDDYRKNPESYNGNDEIVSLKERTAQHEREQQEYRDKLEKIKHIKLTTGYSFTDIQIEEEIGIVTAECVYGMNIFRDMFVGLRDFFGGRSKASQKVLRDARNTCLAELKIEAHDLGADGVIGIDLDYSEISGGGKSGMLLLVASGTAVKFKNSRSIND
tara:strand:- start:963 stop:1559 length:597 start_codon:yes stop_codon:yes gene_type:complete